MNIALAGARDMREVSRLPCVVLGSNRHLEGGSVRTSV
eukprot:CAMPEP_0173381086 /NCGR_PEP_ID=MMETSP1356-20130122/3574_1 /TAXON_ID=77927 ORGANISM="Hemiselmis virescens, Strain PCC157" /NCGR_SAMPLE_ID=MMETSP1356 /ASSEMBLY_ACC=CAM_ASM_000847 /LENGTH=37 /DNA_ID= /DNA_START= /DNA_END= /DNA_ORIENTATION=